MTEQNMLSHTDTVAAASCEGSSVAAPAGLETVKSLALRAQAASRVMGLTTTAQRNDALRAIAEALRAQSAAILRANKKDMDRGIHAALSAGLLDRLRLTEERIQGMATALEDLIALPDPLGAVIEERTLEQGLQLKRVRVALGVVAMVYEARPNVTIDAAGICIKTGNACVLRGGSQAIETNTVLAHLVRQALQRVGLPADAVCFIQSTDRGATDELMSLHGIVDVLIPRGGAGLIRHCVEHARVPVIETGTGNCHTYIHASADKAMACDIIMNAKTQRVGVCNACESVLIDDAMVDAVAFDLAQELAQHGVRIHADQRILDAVMAKEALHGVSDTDNVDASQAAQAISGTTPLAQSMVLATPQDWGTEYLALELSMKSVSGVQEAVEHINTYGTGHSECIVANPATESGQDAINRFYAGVDAAAVYANASTRFTDGGCFGLGAEIGISTQKLHARGPFALEALTSYKYLISGTGQVRA